ncbi:MAG: hypothetical protein WA702_13105, partial [Bradyrhizobium sp.]
MGQTLERLREYLGQLPPAAQALLTREFERAIERGQDVAVATMVLDQLRKVARPVPEPPARPAQPSHPKLSDEARQSVDAPRRLFRPLEPFITESTGS